MKQIKLIPAAIIAFAMTGAIMTGCKKDQNTMAPASTPQTADGASLRTVYDNATAEASFDDIGNVANEGVRFGTYGFNHLLTSCATITIVTDISPHTAVIDYGTTDCLSKDGNYRRGQIMVTWTGDYRQPGTVITITPQNYYLNFNKIEGTKTITNLISKDANNLTYPTFSIKVNGTVTIDPQYSINGTGGIMTYTADKTKEWIKGEDTPQWDDDVYLVSGTVQGTTTANIMYSAITDPNAPLRLEIGFPHFTSGILNISQGVVTGVDASVPVRVDYSYLNNQRDDLARVTINGKTYTIHLGMRSL